MSDMNARDENLLDRSLYSYYRELAEAPIPVKLHGRTVRSLEARGDRGAAWRRLRPRRSWIAPAVVVGFLVAAVVVVGLPLFQSSQNGIGGPSPSETSTSPTVTPTSSALASGTTRITVMNLGARSVSVEIDGKAMGQLACGQTGEYAVTDYPSEFKVDIDGSPTTYTLTEPSEDLWWVWRGGGWAINNYAPAGDRSYLLCPTESQGTDPAGQTAWRFDYPVISGTNADQQVNQTISAAVDQWALGMAGNLRTLRSETATLTGSTVISGSYWTKTTMPGLLGIDFTFWAKTDAQPAKTIVWGGNMTWKGYLTIDLSDGHLVGVDELFTNPADGLAILSAQSRKLLGMPADGGAYAAETSPDAANFAMWYASNDGLEILFQDATKASSPYASLYQTSVLIPWSELNSVIKEDSAVRLMHQTP